MWKLLGAAILCLFPAAGLAAEAGPLGSWKADGDCFLVEFVLAKDGAYLAYDSGEEEEGGTWSWDGKVLKIASSMYNKDSFAGRLAGDKIDAKFTWHDADTDTLHPQNCVFTRVKLKP